MEKARYKFLIIIIIIIIIVIIIISSTHGDVVSYRTPKCFVGKQIAIYQKIFQKIW